MRKQKTRVNANGEVEVMFTCGREARAPRDEMNRRVYGSFKVRMQVQLSPLSITNDTLEFWVYQRTGEEALERVSYLLHCWYVEKRMPKDGYPKPVGLGAAVATSDKEFRMTWQQAVNSGKEVERSGDQRDPLAFHIRPTSRIITTA